jgi:nucleotide-binding universal stress UspA family protein
MFRRILIPVDFSPKNDAAVAMALDLARRGAGEEPAEVLLLHAIETIEHMDFSEMSDFYRKLEARAAAKLIVLGERFLTAGIRVHQEVLFGHRAATILRHAVEQKVDLILLSSHRIDTGRTPEGGPGIGMALGAISYQVAFVAPCPVLLVK